MSEPTYPQLVAETALRIPDRELAVDESERYTYAQFDEAMMRAARAAIAVGVRPGDRVAVWAPNSARWLIAAMGASAAGGVIVPMNTRYKGIEAMAAIRRVEPRVLFTTRAFLDTDHPAMLRAVAGGPLDFSIVVLDAAAGEGDLSWEQFLAGGEAVTLEDAVATRDAVPSDTPAEIILTSGTTGEPKGVVTTHRQNVVAWGRYIDHLGLDEGERINATLPFFHNFGLKAGFLIAVQLGGTCVCESTFDPARLVRRIRTERISYLPGTPTLFAELLKGRSAQGLDLPSLRRCMVAGTVVPVELVSRIRQDLDIEVFTGYGLSELAGGVSLTPPGASAERIANWAGTLVKGVETRVIDEADVEVEPGVSGEILVRSDCTMIGYLDDASSTAAIVDDDGWLHTGDIGIVDDERYVKIVDRKKDMFIVGGFNAYPAEIEQLLMGQGSLAQVAVIGTPDERLGEVGVAFVVPRPGADVDSADVLAWARANIANYKVPRRVVVVGELPLNASLKVVKSELRQLLMQGADT